MKRLSIAAISVRFIFVLGFVVWAFQISLSVAFGAEKLSESYQSLEFDEAEGEETSSLLPESMILVWDINYTIYAHRQDHLLNPEKTFFSFDHRKALTSLDLEWTPKLSESLSLRTREVLEYISLDRKSDIGITLLEGYFEWKNRHQDVIVDIGKIKLEWGSGYAWRPTQVLFEGDNSVDTDKESAAGVEMALLEFVIKNTTNTLLVAGMKDEDDSGNNNQLQAAYRISLESQSWELSLLYHKTSDAVITTGLSFTGLLSDALEIHGEWASSNKRDRLTIAKASDGFQTGPVYLPARYEYKQDSSHRNFDKMLIGAQYTFANDMNVIFELYRTMHGYSETEWQRIQTGIDEALTDNVWKNELSSSQGNPYAGFLQQTMGLNETVSLRQNYLFLRWTTGESEDLWEWEQIVQLNLDDYSQISVGKLRKSWSISTKTEFSCHFFRGDRYSEQELNPYAEFCSLSMVMGF